LYLEPQYDQFQNILKNPPTAYALIKGSPDFSNINGTIFFYQLTDGVLAIAQVNGLPQGADNCSANVFGFHIHEGSSCNGTAEFRFASSGPHYNPNNCPHPAHAGDMPPLFGNHGSAFMVFTTDRFSIKNIIGRTVIVHSSPDDFTTQPAGNSGTKIACGQIMQNAR